MSCLYTNAELAEIAQGDNEADAEKARELLESRGLTVADVTEGEQ